jgi:hypothetical protein
MFSEQVFIDECNAFLRTNTYVDFEDVRVDIEFYIRENLDADMIDQVPELAGKILDAYINQEFDNAFSDARTADEDIEVSGEIHGDEDDILFRAVEIWLANEV